MPARDRDFERALGYRLTFDEREIVRPFFRVRSVGKRRGGQGRKRRKPRQMVYHFFERFRRVDLHAAHVPRLFAVAVRHDEFGKAFIPRGDDGGQYARYRS